MQICLLTFFFITEIKRCINIYRVEYKHGYFNQKNYFSLTIIITILNTLIFLHKFQR